MKSLFPADASRSRMIAERLSLLFVLIAYYMGGYFVLNVFNENRSYYVNVALPFETSIPFMAMGAWPYSGVFACIVLGFHSMPVERIALFRRGALLFFVNLTVSFACFVVLPVKALHRPPPPTGESLTEMLAAFWFWVDKPTNLFPSLHVNLSLIGALVGLSHSRFWGGLALLTAIGVAVGAIMLHQHYLADVIAGAVLAVGTYYWLFVSAPARSPRASPAGGTS